MALLTFGQSASREIQEVGRDVGDESDLANVESQVDDGDSALQHAVALQTLQRTQLIWKILLHRGIDDRAMPRSMRPHSKI